MATKIFLSHKEHVQSVPASEWLIAHNFGRLPIVDVFVQLPGWDTPRKVVPEEVIAVDANNVKITFAGNSVAGRAVLR